MTAVPDAIAVTKPRATVSAPGTVVEAVDGEWVQAAGAEPDHRESDHPHGEARAGPHEQGADAVAAKAIDRVQGPSRCDQAGEREPGGEQAQAPDRTEAGGEPARGAADLLQVDDGPDADRELDQGGVRRCAGRARRSSAGGTAGGSAWLRVTRPGSSPDGRGRPRWQRTPSVSRRTATANWRRPRALHRSRARR